MINTAAVAARISGGNNRNNLEVKRFAMIERLKWMRVVRFFSSMFALLLYLVLYKFKILLFPIAPFISLCLAEGLLNQPYAFIVGRVKDLYRLAYFHLFVDLILISGIIHFVGGIEISFFNAIYPLVIVSAAITLSRKATFQITGLASGLFVLLVFLEYFNLVPHVPVLGFQLHGNYQIALVAANIIFFYFVAFLATYSRGTVDEKNRLLKESKEYAEKLLGLMTDGLMVLNLDGKIRNLNRAVEKALKFGREELIGKQFVSTLCPEERQKQMQNILSNFRVVGELVDFETDFLTKSGEVAPVRLNASLINETDPRLSGILLIFHNMVPEREAEKVKTVFLSELSRELNSPLTVLKGFIKTMLEEKEIGAGEREGFLKIMTEEVERLERIMMDLHELAEMEIGWLKIKKTKAQLLDVLREEAGMFLVEAKKRKLIYHVNLPEEMAPIYFDPENIRHAIHNLIENAVKFTPQGEVSIEAAETPESVTVSVSDTGAVISEEELPRVFERFYLEKEKRPALNRMNIRLPVIKHIINAHGGTIWASSRAGDGTRFTFVLPKN